MKKLINNPDQVLTESLSGFVSVHADLLELGAEGKFVRRKQLKPGKPVLISGGGSGHEPLHGGFVGHECWMLPVLDRSLPHRLQIKCWKQCKLPKVVVGCY